MTIDDATRLAYEEVLPVEQKGTTASLLTRAVGWFSAQGITCRRVLSDNGSSYRSGESRKAYSTFPDLRETEPLVAELSGFL